MIGRYALRGGLPVYGNYPARFRTAVGHGSEAEDVQLETCLSWKDLEGLRAAWPGRLVVKGVLTAEDARACARAGADAVVVSSHGGRNLDVLPSPADVLESIAEAVGGEIEVLADSGVRRGTDALKYLALGARMVLLGRLPLYALAAGGESGAEAALGMFLDEIRVAMGFLGARRPEDLYGRAVRGKG